MEADDRVRELEDALSTLVAFVDEKMAHFPTTALRYEAAYNCRIAAEVWWKGKEKPRPQG